MSPLENLANGELTIRSKIINTKAQCYDKGLMCSFHAIYVRLQVAQLNMTLTFGESTVYIVHNYIFNDRKNYNANFQTHLFNYNENVS